MTTTSIPNKQRAALPSRFLRRSLRGSALFLSYSALCMALCAAQPAARAFDIPAGDARETLREFARQAGVEIMFSAEHLGGARTSLVRGELATEAALAQLLEGTGLTASIDPSSGAISVRPKATATLPQGEGKAPSSPRTEGAAALADDGVITLSQFNVTANPTTGYRASNSITATGIGTAIIDTPIPISIVSTELLADTANTELREALNFVPGVLTNPRAESTFIVRGYSGLTAYRNGFYRRQLFPTWNTDRVEVVKGPSAIFFGVTRPGGVINYVTQKPLIGNSFADVKATVGSDSYLKGELYGNISLSDTFAIRVGLGVIDAGGPRELEYKRENYQGLSFTWAPSPRHQLTLDLEHVGRTLYYLNSYGGRALSNSLFLGNTSAPVVDQTKKSADTALKEWLAAQGYSSTPGTANYVPRYDIFAPIYGDRDPSGATIALTKDALNTFKSETIDLDYLFQITPTLVWQTTLNHSLDDTAGVQPTDGETRPYADGTVRFKFEDWNNIRRTDNIHNKLTWRFDLGPTKHTLQLGQELQHIVYDRPGYLDSGNKFNESVYGAYVYNVRLGTDYVSVFEGMKNGTQTANIVRTRRDDSMGYFAAMQSRFFDEKLHLLYGARYNDFKGSSRYSRPVQVKVKGETVLSQEEPYAAEGGLTPQLGALWKVLPGLSAFTTFSRAIEPDMSVDADGVASEPVKSKGLDAGLKGELLEGRAAFTATYYTIERENLKYTDTDRQLSTGRSPYYIFGNAERSSGIELEVNLVPVRGWQLIGGWNHFLEAKTLRSNSATLVGARMPYTPDNSYSLWNRYEFQDGALRGLVIGGGFRHNDRARISNDPQVTVSNPGFAVYDLMASYPVRTFGRTWKLQANVKNVGNTRYREGTDGYFGPLRQVVFSAQTRF